MIATRTEKDWWLWALARYGKLIARAVRSVFRAAGRWLFAGLEGVEPVMLISEAIRRLDPRYWVPRLREAVRLPMGYAVNAAADDERVRFVRGKLIEAIRRAARKRLDELLASVAWLLAWRTFQGDIVRALRMGLIVGGVPAAIGKARELFRRRPLNIRSARIGHAEGQAGIGGGKDAARSVLYPEGYLDSQQWRALFRNTRHDHAEADGQIVGIGKRFVVGGELARFPGDPQLSAAQRCNCQCWTTAFRRG